MTDVEFLPGEYGSTFAGVTVRAALDDARARDKITNEQHAAILEITMVAAKQIDAVLNAKGSNP